MLPTLAHRVCDPTTDTIDAAFVGDIGLTDGTRLAPDTKFRKTWQVRNTGDCSWPVGTELVRIAGDPLPGPQIIPISQTSPGRDIIISVELTAPAKPGEYENSWRLRTPAGRLFGAILLVQIIVEEAPTPTVTPTGDTSSTCGALDDRFHSVINQATALGIQVLCATGPVETIPGQIQVFRQNVDQDDLHLCFQSFMILRNDTDRIYVLNGKDTNTYEATVTTHAGAEDVPPDEEPATCSGLAVPEGYVVPTGRIGAAWCNHSLWISAAGWPWEPAADATLDIQETTNGLLIEATTDATATRAAQVYLIAIDFGARRATVD
ncbi:MAG: NBR1-Ig-like domain-containing protein [Anaerolineae bacterium]|nr:NBR1-Ig-like domain-containing protein [Anaerolineae bacterium]